MVKGGGMINQFGRVSDKGYEYLKTVLDFYNKFKEFGGGGFYGTWR